MEIRKISLFEKFGHGTFSISNNIVVQFVVTFILFFYTDVVGIAPAAAGMILAIGMVWDGITDPIVANMVDNHRFKNGERVRPFILTCFPLTVVIIIMFIPVSFSAPTLTFLYCLVLYLIYDTLTTILRLPHYAMPTLATNNQQDRLSINTFFSGGATLGAVLASVLCWPLVRLFSGVNADGNMINPERGFPITAAVIGIFIIAGSMHCYIATRERVRPKNEDEEKLSLFRSFKIIMSDYNSRWNTAFSTLYFVNNSLLTTSLVYYCAHVYKNEGAVTIIMAMFAIGSIMALPTVKLIDRKLGRRKAMMIGATLIILSKIPFVISPLSMVTMYMNAFIMGLSVALNLVTFSTTRAEVADHIEYVNDRRLDSMVVNFMGLINKCGTALTTLGIGFVLQFTGYNAELSAQPQAVTTGLIAIMGWAPIILSIVMLFCASKITIEKVVKEMKEAQAI
ncbi:MAG: MFS transporter [Oscillospiraceae bacterium]|jgi:sugar (glycoside-pentoside-hexuronide) transporter|nr:MFS transporter [Oscillospiraceae bacterium]